MGFTKIKEEELVGRGVVGLPDRPSLSTLDMQKKFDELAKDVIIPKFNELSEELESSILDTLTEVEANEEEGKIAGALALKAYMKYVIENFLPLTGGTLSGNTRLEKSTPAFTLKNTDNDIEGQMYVDSNKNVYFRSIESGSYSGFKILPFTTQGINLFKACASNGEWYLFGEHNKPSGSYTGNGSVDVRNINTGGIGNLVAIWSVYAFCFLMPTGHTLFYYNDVIQGGTNAMFQNGNIYLNITHEALNHDGTIYYYQVL